MAKKVNRSLKRTSKVKEGKKLGFYAFGPFEEDYPTGHIAGFLDPNGNLVELSYGQPIGL